jgi:hypothetical protein
MTPSDVRQSQAEEALKNADAVLLKRLFDDSTKEIGLLVESLKIMLNTDKVHPRANDTAIEAMRDVALAAIALARDVAGVGK